MEIFSVLFKRPNQRSLNGGCSFARPLLRRHWQQQTNSQIKPGTRSALMFRDCSFEIRVQNIASYTFWKCVSRLRLKVRTSFPNPMKPVSVSNIWNVVSLLFRMKWGVSLYSTSSRCVCSFISPAALGSTCKPDHDVTSTNSQAWAAPCCACSPSALEIVL